MVPPPHQAVRFELRPLWQLHPNTSHPCPNCGADDFEIYIIEDTSSVGCPQPSSGLWLPGYGQQHGRSRCPIFNALTVVTNTVEESTSIPDGQLAFLVNSGESPVNG